MAKRAAERMAGPGTEPILSRLGRYGFALAIVLALPVLFFVLGTVINGMTPDGRPIVGWPGTGPCAAEEDEHDRIACLLPTLSKLPLEFEWNRKPPEGSEPPLRPRAMVLAEDVQARYGFAVPAALLIFLALPTVAVGLIGLSRREWRGWLPVGVLVALAAAVAGLHFQDSHPVRQLSAEHVLWLAANDGGYVYLTRELWEFAFAAVDVTTVAAMAASAVLIVLFAALSVRARPATLTAAQLRQRADWFKTALGLGSAVLVLAVATTHGLFHWSSALMAPGSREPLQSLASSASLYWGVIHSLTLVMVTVPTVASIRLDAAALPKGGDGEGVREVLEEAGLAFDLRRSLVTLMTIAGPVLTGPALDLLEKMGS
jgi:hypothetical protein